MLKNIPELPCESFVRRLIGDQWRNLPDRDRDGALGLAIVKSVFDGVTPELNDISSHLGVNKEVLWKAFRRLKMNGIFQDDRISRETLKDDDTNWCFYAGYASGYIGPWLPDEDKNG